MGLAFIGTLCSAHSVGVVQVSPPPVELQTDPTHLHLVNQLLTTSPQTG